MSKTDFSEREQKLMAFAWQCMDAEPSVNFTKLCGLAGYTNVGSARNAWAGIKKKLVAQAGDSAEDGNASANGTPKASAGKKRGRKPKAAENGDDDDDEEIEESPIKKAKPGKKGKATTTPKKSKAKVDDADEAEEEDVSAVKDEVHDEGKGA